MKKKLALILSAAVLIAALYLVQGANAASDVCFVAINEQLMELNDDTIPITVGGTLYVPYGVFNSTTLRVFSTYSRTSQSVIIYSLSATLVFDIARGGASDGEDYTSDASAIYRDDRPYVPLAAVCEYFGFDYSYTTDLEYGDLLRIKTEYVRLSDYRFIDAAMNMMSERYAAYTRPTTPVQPTPTVSRPVVSTAPEKRPLYLCVRGIDENTETLLRLADAADVPLTFVLDEEDVQRSGDILRGIVCSGASVVIAPGADGAAVNDELCRQTLTKTLLAASGTDGYIAVELPAAVRDESSAERLLAATRGEVCILMDSATASELLGAVIDDVNGDVYEFARMTESSHP